MKRHRTARSRFARARPRPRRGLSLVEIMVAILLLGVGVLGLAGFSLAAGKQMKGAGYQETAAMVVQSRLDSLASIRCNALAASGTQTGSATTMGVKEAWVVADGNDIKIISDTVRFTGRTRPMIYNSIIPCRD